MSDVVKFVFRQLAVLVYSYMVLVSALNVGELDHVSDARSIESYIELADSGQITDHTLQTTTGIELTAETVSIFLNTGSFYTLVEAFSLGFIANLIGSEVRVAGDIPLSCSNSDILYPFHNFW